MFCLFFFTVKTCTYVISESRNPTNRWSAKHRSLHTYLLWFLCIMYVDIVNKNNRILALHTKQPLFSFIVLCHSMLNYFLSYTKQNLTTIIIAIWSFIYSNAYLKTLGIHKTTVYIIAVLYKYLALSNVSHIQPTLLDSFSTDPFASVSLTP